jgi:hypothetical protein
VSFNRKLKKMAATRKQMTIIDGGRRRPNRIIRHSAFGISIVGKTKAKAMQ